MAKILEYAVGVVMALVVITLITGVVSMFKGGAFNKKYSNKLMRLRVALQALALALFAIFMLFFRHG
ncbi:MAG TPA: twin transmembrane helix small protein [Alphaproteobacteria bacterium]|nr:twin transmembrane helix small protein [Alphaproteobacteria bacterium]